MYHYPKNFLTIEQLIEKITDAGMEISSEEEVKNVLSTIGYYRLKGYSFQHFDSTTGRYKEGTKLSDILKLYQFDVTLSHLLFSYLSQIEVALRTRLVQAFQITQDGLALNDPSLFQDKSLYWKNQGSIASEIARSNDVFIKHNFTNHDGAIPLWATVEIMSFGTLSKIIKNLQTGNNSVFTKVAENYRFISSNGNEVLPSKAMLASWIQAVSIMRNVCAHNGRIYNRAINTRPQLIGSDIINPHPRYNGLYQIMLSMKYLSSYFLRALFAIVIGILLIKNPGSIPTGITMLAGFLFLISGIISCSSYIGILKAGGIDSITGGKRNPIFPIVGLGCLLFGAVMMFDPEFFVRFLMYIFGGILVLGAINEFVILTRMHRVVKVSVFFCLIF